MSNNSTQRILDTWIALEVLEAGASYDEPEDLEKGSSRKTVRFSSALPWEQTNRQQSKDGFQDYYEVILGSVKLDEASELINKSFPDTRPERPSTKRFAPLATFLVDSNGRPTSKNDINVSSFCWAFSKAMKKDFTRLSAWPDENIKLKKILSDALIQKNDVDDNEPISLTLLNSAFHSLVINLEIPEALCCQPSITFRIQCSEKKKETPELLLLNSFYVEDLVLARTAQEQGKLPRLVTWYLEGNHKESPVDILNTKGALEQTLAPSRYPLARWPGPGRFPLATLQQAAVNLAGHMAEGEILAVNGPPGTGKTTLLRDIVASLVEKRASIMVQYDDPEKAFVPANEQFPVGSYRVRPYSMDQKLRGYEIIISSSNNKAVENVSRELPGIKAIADDATELRYFKTVSDELLKTDTWGLIAAVLGNSTNRKNFKDQFWFNKETGLQSYLQAINHSEAVSRWIESKQRYMALKQKLDDIFSKREELRQRICFLPDIIKLISQRETLTRTRPRILKRLFRTSDYRTWKSLDETACAGLCKILKSSDIIKFLPSMVQEYIQESVCRKFSKTSRYERINQSIDILKSSLETELQTISFEPFTDDLWNTKRDYAQAIGPWFSMEEHRLRDELFQSALCVHRAFIDAAAEPLRKNLIFTLKLLDGETCQGMTDGLVRDMITSLFLIVPCVSTTFASVYRMLGSFPRESIGWLVVDEAGQAKPQQVVGALLRSRRAVIVGDPLQIPPVVGISENMVETISKYLGVEYLIYCAPIASVQTLSDRANRFVSQFSSHNGTRSVGIPLLVHRRCSNPMFSISNRIAYGNQMVNAKTSKTSLILSKVGPSRWIDIKGTGTSKWCSEEGLFVLRQCEALASSGISLNLYIISPFVQVTEGLKSLFKSSAILSEKISDFPDWISERIGTVHTVQGREADAVFFVLGAPNENQRGARQWAGSTPNLINVAVTRARECLYVVGNADLWKTAGFFGGLLDTLQRENIVD